MRLIVGLGNPGPEYQWTPHNLGFLAVDEIANRASIRVERPEGMALIGLGKVAGEEVILAYKVAKHREGIYVYHQVRTNHGELVHEIERRLGVLDAVIKYQTIRLDEELKRQKKLSHKREVRAARRPRRITQPPAPAAPAEQQASTS